MPGTALAALADTANAPLLTATSANGVTSPEIRFAFSSRAESSFIERPLGNWSCWPSLRVTDSTGGCHAGRRTRDEPVGADAAGTADCFGHCRRTFESRHRRPARDYGADGKEPSHEYL